jgi:uncharacterized membrane protein YfcA
VHLDPYVALAGLVVGFTVGMTGTGGGALMTPVLVLLFNVQPFAAVSSDIVASLFMRPVGAAVHINRRTVRWPLVKWLAIGSVPSAFVGVFVLRSLGDSQHLQDRIKLILGGVLLFAAAAMLFKLYLTGRQTRLEEAVVRRSGTLPEPPQLVVKVLPTLAVGIIGGLVVGMTSVGSGSLIIISLSLMYPALRGPQLVGTDLVQAVPLVASAALAQILFGRFELGLTTSILIGSLPGVYMGARLSSRAPDSVIRSAIVFVLLGSGLKLVNVPTETLGWILLAVVLVAFPLWGAIDAAGRPAHEWAGAGMSKRTWVGLQAAGALFGIGFAAAVAYFTSARPRLQAVPVPLAVTVPVPVD